MSLPVNQVVCGSCVEEMQKFPPDSIDLVVTSPPYWGLRDYGSGTVRVWGGNPECEHTWGSSFLRIRHKQTGKQASNRGTINRFEHEEKLSSDFCIECGAWRGSLGLEPHPQLFIDHLVKIFREVKRVLKPSGTFWLNLGDTYYGGGAGQLKSGIETKGKMTEASFIGASRAKEQIPNKPLSNWLRPKQKLMIPSRVAIALQHDGWILRSDIIWHKPNHMPSSVKDRLTCAYEHVFLFAKQRRYYFDLDAIRKPVQKSDYKNYEGKLLVAERSKQLLDNRDQLGKPNHPKGKNPGDVWSSSKYQNHEEERNLRRGIYQGKEFDLVTVRPNLPAPNVISVYLKQKRESQGLTIRKIAEKLDLKIDLVSHWFRTDEYFNYPSPSDWARLTEILSLEKYHEEMTYVETRSAYIEKHPRGKNPGDLWRIPTSPFPGAHFATFPPKLIEPIIKAGSPRWICSRCGKPRTRISETEYVKSPVHGDGSIMGRRDGGDKLTHYNGLPRVNAVHHTVGWSDCGCGEDWIPGVVLDPFGGSGTVGQVARRLGRRFILIEIIPEYCKMAEQRVRGRYDPIPAGATRLDQFMEAEE